MTPTLLQQKRALDGRGEAGGLHLEKSWDSRPPRSAADTAADGGKGAISLLQEFVQCTKTCSGPQDRPVLQWSFQQRATAGPLEFCATVALVLDGVPHHVMGAWHASKKAAQRDAADRALGYFVGAWGEALQRQAPGSEAPAAPAAARACGGGVAAGKERRALEEHCASEGGVCGGRPPAWSCRWEGDGRCVATAELEILGVRHRLVGAPRGDEQAAIAAASRRILWYFQCPGYENAFVPDPAAPAATARDIPAAPANWSEDR